MVKRILRACLTLILVLTFVFIGSRSTGNPFEVMFPEGLTQEDEQALMNQFGLDKPLHIQFGRYLLESAKGNFGRSIHTRQPVVEVFRKDFFETLRLGIWAFFFSAIMGVSLGMYSAFRENHLFSRIITSAFAMGYAIPHFILAILMLIIFSYKLQILPSLGGGEGLSFIMPTLALSIHPIASISRFVRNNLLDVFTQDYIRTAQAKGFSNSSIVMHHAFRNTLIPLLTIIGFLVTDIVGGSVVVETIFSWPGMGKRLVGAVSDRDYPVLQFGVICFSGIVIVVNLLIDMLYAVVDPRIRVES